MPRARPASGRSPPRPRESSSLPFPDRGVGFPGISQRLLVLDLQVLPRIGVTGGDGREDILPFLRRHPRANRVDERVAKHGYHVVVLEDPALDLLGQLLSLCRIDRRLVLVELAVEVPHADAVTRVEAAALEEGLIPE